MNYNYDTIAAIYDRLSRVVYGNKLREAQQYLLAAVPAGAHILIAGGGTGWVLEALTEMHPAGLTIDYIDNAAGMIALARQRKTGDNKVSFITAAVQDMAHTSVQYDVVMTPFLLDNFTSAMLQQIFPLLDQQLRRNGIWLYCDFQDTEIRWQRFMLRMMYIFFRLCCGIKAKRLPDTATLFAKYGYTIVQQRTYMSGFVAAIVYRRA